METLPPRGRPSRLRTTIPSEAPVTPMAPRTTTLTAPRRSPRRTVPVTRAIATDPAGPSAVATTTTKTLMARAPSTRPAPEVTTPMVAPTPTRHPTARVATMTATAHPAYLARAVVAAMTPRLAPAPAAPRTGLAIMTLTAREPSPRPMARETTAPASSEPLAVAVGAMTTITRTAREPSPRPMVRETTAPASSDPLAVAVSAMMMITPTGLPVQASAAATRTRMARLGTAAAAMMMRVDVETLDMAAITTRRVPLLQF